MNHLVNEPNPAVCTLISFLLTTAQVHDCEFPAVLQLQQLSFQDRLSPLWMTTWAVGLVSETLEVRLAVSTLEAWATYLCLATPTEDTMTTDDLFTTMGMETAVLA